MNRYRDLQPAAFHPDGIHAWIVNRHELATLVFHTEAPILRAPRLTASSSCATISLLKSGSSILLQSISVNTMNRSGYGFTILSSTPCSFSPHIPVEITIF